MDFGLIIIGDEILSGKRADKHMPKVIELLSARGLSLAWARYVGDDPVRITAHLRDAFAGSDIVFSVGDVHFVPGFPVMAHPMIEWLLDHRYADLRRHGAWQERSVIVFGSMEATLTPLMESIESRFPGVKVFSLPSVDHPEYGRHIELGVKGHVAALEAAYAALLMGLKAHDAALGPELVR